MCTCGWSIHTCIFMCRLENNVKSLSLSLSILFSQLPFLRKEKPIFTVFFKLFRLIFEIEPLTEPEAFPVSQSTDLLNKLIATKSPEMIKRRFFNKHYP